MCGQVSTAADEIVARALGGAKPCASRSRRAVMALRGERAWWMPKRLGRALPELDIEGEKLAHSPA